MFPLTSAIWPALSSSGGIYLICPPDHSVAELARSSPRSCTCQLIALQVDYPSLIFKVRHCFPVKFMAIQQFSWNPAGGCVCINNTWNISIYVFNILQYICIIYIIFRCLSASSALLPTWPVSASLEVSWSSHVLALARRTAREEPAFSTAFGAVGGHILGQGKWISIISNDEASNYIQCDFGIFGETKSIT